MRDKNKLTEYTYNLKKVLSKYVKKGIPVQCNIYPIRQHGGVVELLFGQGAKNRIKMMSQETTINSLLKKIPQQMVSANIDNVSFKGTNLYMEGNRILIIKGDDDLYEWSQGGAKKDVARIIDNMGKADVS